MQADLETTGARGSSVTIVCIACITLCCCSDTSLVLRVTPGSQASSEQRILALTDRLHLVLDAANGFAESHASSSFTAGDVDNDNQVELALERDLTGRDALPLFDLAPGANLERVFDAQVFAFDGETIAASGQATSLRFEAGQRRDVIIPLNLRAAYLPPTVLVSSPADRDRVGPALAGITVWFSKAVEHASLDGGIRLVLETGRAAKDGLVVELSIEPELDSLGRTRAMVRLGCSLASGTYRLEVDDFVRDTKGNALSPEFNARFVVDGSTPPTAGSPCAGRQEQCERDEQCNPDGGDKFVCAAVRAPQTISQCVPRTTAANNCGRVDCPTELVCQPARRGPRGEIEPDQCVRRCSRNGNEPQTISCEAQQQCDLATGLCIPCEDIRLCVTPIACYGYAVDRCDQKYCVVRQKCTPDGKECESYCEPRR